MGYCLTVNCTLVKNEETKYIKQAMEMGQFKELHELNTMLRNNNLICTNKVHIIAVLLKNCEKIKQLMLTHHSYKIQSLCDLATCTQGTFK